MAETATEQTTALETPGWKRRLGEVKEALLDVTGFGQVNWIKAYSKGKLGSPCEGLAKLLVAEQTFLTVASRLLTLLNVEQFSQGDFLTPFLPVMTYGAFQGLLRKTLIHTLSRQTSKGS